MLVESRTAAWSPAARTSHHVPHVVGQPVNDGIAATHKLQVLGLGRLLRHEENHKAGGHKGHGHDDEDGDDHVGALQPGHREEPSDHWTGPGVGPPEDEDGLTGSPRTDWRWCGSWGG